MNELLLPSDACYALIRKSEYALGIFPCRAYWDVNGWACGYGSHAPDVQVGTEWDQNEAEARMRQYALQCAKDIKQLVTVALTQGQFDALVDWSYQFGGYGLHGTTLLRDLNQSQYDAAGQQLPLWIHVRKDGVLVEDAGLLARREAELALWNSRG